ncbi:polyribonucleotide nucleotidyltransferase 2, mitochondrial [Canna indica]|uniref:Polyribonucleotide nucleotidyltransferase 2, mitochondrial n=1 Tax=Canna indica TaxID=4628 RepID=A0AAQ3K9A6_9LILI|nr:polyribonucleotide nucleotidyltransferase 2, mitochondrial [Canna indica]
MLLTYYYAATLKYTATSLRRSIGSLISQRKKIEQETGARVSVSDGAVTIVAKNQSIMEKAQEKVSFLIGSAVEIGGIYKGIVSSVKEYGAFIEFNGGQQGLLHISELSHEPVSRVSDVLSVGQELSLMCIGQDVRGNIKLSLKAIIPKQDSQKSGLDSQDSVASAKQSVNVWASPSLENSTTSTQNLESSNDLQGGSNEMQSVTCSSPAVVIRSAAECDAQDPAAGGPITRKPGKLGRSSPRPHNGSLVQKLPGSRDDKSVVTKRQIKKKKEKDVSSCIKLEADSTIGSVSVADNVDEKPEPTINAGSLKLGDRVTAKIYQIRAHGLVLELRGGIRGMYKFEVNGRMDFEVGKELHVRCSSFSSKGIPVFSLLKDE